MLNLRMCEECTTDSDFECSVMLASFVKYYRVAGLSLVLLLNLEMANSWSQNPAPRDAGSPTAVESLPTAVDAGDQIDQMITRLALANLPREFSDTKKWGGQAERWDGLELERDGLKIETRRRKKMVNHGTWKKYSAELRNPAEEFQIQIKNIHESTNGKLALEVHVASHLNIEGRQAEWVKGVQLYSVNATGHAQVRLQLSLEIGVHTNLSRFPPDLILTPSATAAKLTIEEFRIDRISKIGGEFTQQISDEVQSLLTEKMPEYEQKLVAQINKQIAQEPNGIRLSLVDAAKSKWGESLNGVLPTGGQFPIP